MAVHVQSVIVVLVLVGLNNWGILEESEHFALWFEPGLVAPVETWVVSFKSQVLALTVEPVSTVGDGCWVIELNGVLVSTTIKGKVPASSDAINLFASIAVEMEATLENVVEIPVGV
jgi:hypothetical protein